MCLGYAHLNGTFVVFGCEDTKKAANIPLAAYFVFVVFISSASDRAN